jgi:hypothetical protein
LLYLRAVELLGGDGHGHGSGTWTMQR